MPALTAWGVTPSGLEPLLGGVKITANSRPTEAAVQALIVMHADTLDGELEALGLDVAAIQADDSIQAYAPVRSRAWQIVARLAAADVLEGLPGDRRDRVEALRKRADRYLERLLRAPGVAGDARATGPGAPALAASQYDARPYPTNRAPSSLGDRLWTGRKL